MPVEVNKIKESRIRIVGLIKLSLRIAKYIFLDSDWCDFSSVYEGVKSFYKEDDEAVPVNVYGKSKVAAEQFITEKCSNFAILRSSIIFGPQTISPVSKSLPIQVHKEKTDLYIRLD